MRLTLDVLEIRQSFQMVTGVTSTELVVELMGESVTIPISSDTAERLLGARLAPDAAPTLAQEATEPAEPARPAPIPSAGPVGRQESPAAPSAAQALRQRARALYGADDDGFQQG
jgi:hypothetical protein